jgi:hypothetical protein
LISYPNVTKMVKNRKELRFYMMSCILVALVCSMTFTTFLSSTYFPSGIGPGASNSFVRLASASSSSSEGGGEGGGGGGGGDDDEDDQAGGGGGGSNTETEEEEEKDKESVEDPEPEPVDCPEGGQAPKIEDCPTATATELVDCPDGISKAATVKECPGAAATTAAATNQPEDCDNGTDDDGDGAADLGDQDCSPGAQGACPPGSPSNCIVSTSPSPPTTSLPTDKTIPTDKPQTLTSTPPSNALLDQLRRQSVVANPTPDCVVGGGTGYAGIHIPDCKDPSLAQFVQTCSGAGAAAGCVVDKNKCADGALLKVPLQGSCGLVEVAEPATPAKPATPTEPPKTLPVGIPGSDVCQADSNIRGCKGELLPDDPHCKDNKESLACSKTIPAAPAAPATPLKVEFECPPPSYPSSQGTYCLRNTPLDINPVQFSCPKGYTEAGGQGPTLKCDPPAAPAAPAAPNVLTDITVEAFPTGLAEVKYVPQGTCTPPPGIFPTGTTTVTCTDDAAGTKNKRTFKVIVNPSTGSKPTPPPVTPPPPTSIPSPIKDSNCNYVELGLSDPDCTVDWDSKCKQSPTGPGCAEIKSSRESFCKNQPSAAVCPTSPSSQSTVKVVNKNVFEGREPIGSSSSSSSSSSSAVTASTPTAKPFPEFNNPANAAAGLVITDTTATKTQPTSGGGQVDIAGRVQNIRTASAPTDATAATDIINTAAMIVVEATFFDEAGNVVEVKNIAVEPNQLGPGESGTFNIVVTGPASSNAAKVTYLAQWVGVDSSGSQMLLHPTAEELQAASTTTTTGTATTPTPTPTPTPSPSDTTTATTSPVVSQ